MFNFIKILAILMVSVFSSLAFANDSDRVRLALFDTPPYVFTSKNILGGLFYELARKLQDTPDINIDLKILPRKRLADSLLSNSQDCTFLADTHTNRRNFSLIEKTGLNIDIGILPKKGVTITKYDDLYRLRIATVRGTKLDKKYDSDRAIEKDFTTDYLMSIKMLVRNRVDAVAGSFLSFRYIAKMVGQSQSDLFGKPLVFASKSIWLVCNHTFSQKEVSKELADRLAKLRNSGAIAKIEEKYN
ncbi:substrate-binding periplasmic protein [Roseibium sp.]|uniref:substrate-binding periplasmic protein n=1 Tax=Roseibium sp. TaxID=1936156 RepID=UPI003B51CF57